MRLTLFLATALFLCSVGFAVSEPLSQISGLQHILTKRQTACTQEDYETFNSTFDPMCIANSNLLGQRATELLNSSMGAEEPDQELIDEVDQLIEKVCTDTCIGGLYDLLQKCEDDFGDLSFILDTFIYLCSFNERFFCVLAVNEITDVQAYATTIGCPFGWLNSTNYTCPSECQNAYETVINDIGCCTNAYLDLILSGYNVTIHDYYSVCQIQDPGDCSAKFLDDSGGTFTSAAKGLSVLMVLIGIAVSTF